MAEVINLDGKPAIDATGSNLNEVNAPVDKIKEVKAVTNDTRKKYENISGPYLRDKKRKQFLAAVNNGATVTELKKRFGFKSKKQIDSKLKMLKKHGYLKQYVKKGTTPETQKPTRTILPLTADYMLDAAASIRVAEMLESIAANIRQSYGIKK